MSQSFSDKTSSYCSVIQNYIIETKAIVSWHDCASPKWQTQIQLERAFHWNNVTCAIEHLFATCVNSTYICVESSYLNTCAWWTKHVSRLIFNDTSALFALIIFLVSASASSVCILLGAPDWWDNAENNWDSGLCLHTCFLLYGIVQERLITKDRVPSLRTALPLTFPTPSLRSTPHPSQRWLLAFWVNIWNDFAIRIQFE